MAQAISLNVYEINGASLGTPKAMAFGASTIVARKYDGSNTSLYGIIEAGSGQSQKSYAVIETVAAIAAACNA